MRTLNTLSLADLGSTRTCCRCGAEFSAINERVCSKCRKPRVRTQRPPAARNLSFRERQITCLVCEAKLNKEIAFELSLTEGTIKEYLNHIFRKLNVKNRTDLAIWAMRNLEPQSRAAGANQPFTPVSGISAVTPQPFTDIYLLNSDARLLPSG